ncbi:hypothetical protein KIH31_12160 [Paenarthrobacter sp. DKR-5]|uniref:hypothetical protein n=1 Tax=Paenarthrobacter sp. DKR-5 TaxID=2835535 RepID=UPI001BDD9FA9|nr:hypothetical protein [Paenarthrobacter sp. DKR-5]MBT1003359.1 hypothetical protein [Paenarthrobacter sp. DKR-5]
MRKRINPAVKIAHGVAFDADGRPKPGLHNVLLRAMDVQRPLVVANLRRLRRKYPHATPAQLSAKLERDFLATVTGGGAAIGATALVPGVGTAAALGLSAAATAGFLEATALYALSVAELHGVHMEDPERARTTVMAIMLGEEGTALLESFSGTALGRGGGPAQHWGTAIGKSVPLQVVRGVGGRIQKAFLKRFVKQQSGAFLGRALPFGVGAVVGGTGNLMMGRAVIAATREAFGPAPELLQGELLDEVPSRFRLGRGRKSE